jgi:hypothetical protein
LVKKMFLFDSGKKRDFFAIRECDTFVHKEAQSIILEIVGDRKNLKFWIVLKAYLIVVKRFFLWFALGIREEVKGVDWIEILDHNLRIIKSSFWRVKPHGYKVEKCYIIKVIEWCNVQIVVFHDYRLQNHLHSLKLSNLLLKHWIRLKLWNFGHIFWVPSCYWLIINVTLHVFQYLLIRTHELRLFPSKRVIKVWKLAQFIVRIQNYLICKHFPQKWVRYLEFNETVL